jgi:hypothetical protein
LGQGQSQPHQKSLHRHQPIARPILSPATAANITFSNPHPAPRRFNFISSALDFHPLVAQFESGFTNHNQRKLNYGT